MSLRIISASAGSGKTYRLGLEYLKLCFAQKDNSYFRHILALTFTNKATEEMKGRILSALRKLALDDPNADYRKELMAHCEWSSTAISEKAKAILDCMLNEYHFYQIQTIDSFLFGLYQSLVTELQVPSGVELHLNQEKLMSEAIREYIDHLEEQSSDWQIIRSLMWREERRGKRFKLHVILEQIAQLLSEESFDGITIFDNPESILRLEDDLKNYAQRMEEQLEAIRSELKQVLNSSGIDPIHFSGGSRSWAVTFLNGDFDLATILNKKTVFDVASGNKGAIAKTDKLGTQVKFDANGRAFQEVFDKILALREERRSYSNTRTILENWDSFFLINALERALFEHLKKASLVTLTQVNQKLHQEMKRSDAPLIYERLGMRIKHILIDEFQDTSVLQWSNLEPLIQESLANGNECLLVGDVKQSIYRFRNGNWRLLQELVPQSYKEFIEKESLETNWRSAPQVIQFNNDFFDFLIPALQNEVVRIKSEEFENISLPYEQWLEEIYADVHQAVAPNNVDKNGLVRIEHLKYENEPDRIKNLDRMMHHLWNALEDGYQLGDIAILVQKHKEAAWVSEYLLEREANRKEKWPHILDAAMELSKIPVVVLLVSLLQVKMEPSNKKAIVRIFRMFHLLEIHRSSATESIENLEAILKDLGLMEIMRYEFNTSLFISKAFKILGLNEQQEHFAAVDFLLTKSQELAARKGVDIKVFLKFWEEELHQQKISVSQLDNQISIVTMHKSKGLEYPVVIIPFANDDLFARSTGRKQFLMCNIGEAQGIEEAYEVPITFGKALETTDFAKPYFEEKAMQIIDLANIYYVAFTRAVDRLYVLSLEKNKNSNAGNMSGYIGAYLNLKNHVTEENWTCYQIGERKSLLNTVVSSESTSEENSLGFYPVRSNWPVVIAGKRVEKILSDSEENVQRQAINEGILIHHILEYVTDIDSIPIAVKKSVIEGLLSSHQAQDWEQYLTALLKSPKLNGFYTNYDKVLNERSMFIPGMGMKVPDRVVMKTEETLVLDYKTGKKSKRHHDQVKSYALALKKMNYPSPKAFLYYLSTKELISVEI